MHRASVTVSFEQLPDGAVRIKHVKSASSGRPTDRAVTVTVTELGSGELRAKAVRCMARANVQHQWQSMQSSQNLTEWVVSAAPDVSGTPLAWVDAALSDQKCRAGHTRL